MTLRRSTPPDAPFIGRDHELDQLDLRLQAGILLTVLGPPGVGKTRLLRQFLRTRWAATSFWVDLTECTDRDQLLGALAGALQIPEGQGAGAAEDHASGRDTRLGRGLASYGAVLMVLDHLERLPGGASLLSTLRAHAPEARLVITSRSVLYADEEQTFTLAPLPLPGSNEPQRVLASDAVQLLLRRAAGYRFRAEDAGVVAELVRQLDGLPLALELAARRLQLLSPADLLDRAEQRLDLLKTRSGAYETSLRQAIESSWQALSEVERATLAQCAVFRGELDVSAAEAVVAADGGSLLLDTLEALVDQSLLQQSEDPAAPRFRLLESIRVFAAERLDLAALQAARLRHAQYFACAPVRHGDIANLHAAYEHACTLPPADGVALRVALLLNLEPLVAAHAPVEGRLSRLDATLAAADGAEHLLPAELARLLRLRGEARQRVGDMIGAEADFERGRALADCDGELEAELNCQLGNLHLAQGHRQQAETSFERAQAALGGRRHALLEGRIQLGRGLLAHSQGRLEDARARYERAVDHTRVAGAAHAEAEALAYLGTLWVQLGRAEQARVHYEDALARLEQGSDRRLTALTLGNLAILDQEQGRFVDAELHLERGLAAAQLVGDRMLEGHLTGYRGCLEHETGKLPRAQRSYERAIALLREVGDIRLEAIFLACLGSVYAARGLLDAAHESFDAAERRLAELGDEGALGAVSLHRGQLLLARARSGQGEGSEAMLQEAARDLLAAGQRDALYKASDDLRFAARLLSAGLETNVLTVTTDAIGVLAVQPPHGEPQDLSARLPQRRILGALVQKRQSHPGEPLSTDELIAAGWPDERMGHEASMNRLKVALAAMRKLGLRDLLLRREGGYLLDPAVALCVSQGAGHG